MVELQNFSGYLMGYIHGEQIFLGEAPYNGLKYRFLTYLEEYVVKKDELESFI